ncbi:helix-turn-helix domain-containing protein [Kitasatospora sp. NBC_00085]|uniref:helix-turn-helix domain-containing protein n=1 Tax=unclassified Kitasatospora TaxID=2633591 RepID=UPI00324BA7B5
MSVETEEFAAMLRELKDRSGRSYGTLAARLHVSTSTLHRYCNGAAVPNEYAPVERLARVCGARADELVELHRRWILADAARRREPSGPPAPAAGPAPEPARAASPAPEPAPHPAPEAAPAPAPEPEPEPQSQPRPQPADDRRRRRLPDTRILLSAAAVAVVAVAAIPVLDLAGRTETPLASRRPPAATASSPAATPPATEPAPATPAAPAPTAPTTATATATGPASSTPEDDAPPFHVNVLADNWGNPCGQWFLTPRAPRAVAAPPSNQRTESWAADQQALPGGHLRLQLTAQGENAKPVVLSALYVEVVSTRPAPKGNAYTLGSGCGGEITPSAFAVDLDSAAPRPVPVPALEGAVKGRTSNFPYSVSATDPQVLNIDARTTSQDVSWNLVLAWSSGDRHGTLPVNDHGKPFRTVGLKGAPGYFYKDERTGWAPTPVVE